jgi:ubiquitin-like 1-activating enzyme E1 A
MARRNANAPPSPPPDSSTGSSSIYEAETDDQKEARVQQEGGAQVESSAAADSSAAPAAAKKQKTHTASDVYDRQIRLWGAESQAKMQKAKILYIHVTGLSAEVIKNLVLAGISATLLDPRDASKLWEAPHFLTPPKKDDATKKSVAQAVQPVIQELNPLLGTCPIVTKSISDLTEDDLKDYTAIVASRISSQDAIRIASLSKSYVYLADCFGLYGAVAMDLKPDFQYRPEQGKAILDPVPLKPYVSLENILSTPLSQAVNRFHKKAPRAWILHRCLLEYYQTKQAWPAEEEGEDNADFDKDVVLKFLKEEGIAEGDQEEIASLVGTVGMAQVAPVCAVLGGLLGNEIIKAISGKGEPANNTLLFDGTLCKAWSFLVQPKN